MIHYECYYPKNYTECKLKPLKQSVVTIDKLIGVFRPLFPIKIVRGLSDPEIVIDHA